MLIKKYIDKRTKAKIRIFNLSIPKYFYDIMLEKAQLKKMSIAENDRSYIEFLNIKSKYYKLIEVEKTDLKDDFSIEIKFTFEKLTNKQSINI